MRKILALILAMLIVFSFATVAYAAEDMTGTQDLSMEIVYPTAHYSVNIPDEVTVTNTTDAQSIGVPTIYDGEGDFDTTGFVGNRYLLCEITSANNFEMKNGDTGIPYKMIASGTSEGVETTRTFGADETVSCFFANDGEGGLNTNPSHAEVDGITDFMIQFDEADLANKYGTFTDTLTYTFTVKDN